MPLSVTRGVETMKNKVLQQVVEKLANEYDFDIETAMQKLELDYKPSNSKAKATKAKATKANATKTKKVTLPFCGKIHESCCKAILKNGGLYSQCLSDPKSGEDYCTACYGKAIKSGGVPPFGNIEDRLDSDYKDKDGNSPITYGNYMASKKITREEAEAEAEKWECTIPEEQFTVIKKKKGRKPNKTKDTEKTKVCSDTEEEEEMSTDEHEVNLEEIDEDSDSDEEEEKTVKFAE